jgi:formylglycine-generating enzyme required for sulfatase activity
MHARRTVWILMTSLLWAVACTSPAGDAPAGTRFVLHGTAAVRDSRTGLEWTRHDDGVGLDWYKAEAYCRALSTGDAGHWRLPAIEELRTLYGATARVPCGDATCAIDPAFTLTSPYVWSATAPGGVARTYLDFQFGTELSPTIAPHLVRRVLCVRAAA